LRKLRIYCWWDSREAPTNYAHHASLRKDS